MNVVILFLLYFALAGGVIFVTSKASNHIDEIDSKTNLGSAVLGGVLLAAVTSLPELVTSTVSSLGIGMEATPSLALGNILGSNLFNMMILGIVDIFFIKRFYLANVDKGNRKANLFVVAMYVILFVPVIIFNLFLGTSTIALITNWSFSILSILLIGVYVVNILNTKTNESNEEEETKETQPIKKNIIMFSLWSALIVIISVCITLVTDNLSAELNLGASFAGAIFLGVATSLPEFTAVITLVKLKNYASAIGNIIGSSLFNLVILSFVDIITPNQNIFSILFKRDEITGNFMTNETNLLILGTFSVLILLYAFTRKRPDGSSISVGKKILYILPSIILVGNYIVYLLLSV
ncbi:MAG: sodium:calcium antiporter [bacterium]